MSDMQSMRPPHSPDRSKIQNGGRAQFAKSESHNQTPSYQGPLHGQQNSYQPQVQGSSVHGLMNQASQNHGTPSSGSHNLAPILGRTSPVSEIRPLALRDERDAPKEQAPTRVGSTQPTPRANSPVAPKEADQNNLKRPREWDDQSPAPEPKKQEMSTSATEAPVRNEDRVDQEKSAEEESAAREQQQQQLVTNGDEKSNQEESAVENKAQEPEPEQSAPAASRELETDSLTKASEPEQKQVPESAERKVDLDEDYDEDD